MIKLSIIIPAYNAEPYISQLIARLHNQYNEDMEIIVIDDGSKFPYLPEYTEIKVIRQENRGVSAARNTGMEEAAGEWIAFIDADDLISDNYVEKVFKALEEDPDYVYLSWTTFGGGWKAYVQIKDMEGRFPTWNQCVWNRIYKRSMIGDVRFNEKKQVAEDAEFIRAVKEEGKKKAFIQDVIYFYRTERRNSLTERFNRGELDTERIVYYYAKIPEDKEVRNALISEIKRDMETSEVIVMTEDRSRDIFSNVCMVMDPTNINATEGRGEYTNLIHIMEKPIKAQVVIYQGRIHEIGGVETWIHNFVQTFKDEYDILVLYDQPSSMTQLERLQELTLVNKNGKRKILCDTLLNMRITDQIPENIVAKKIVQLCHLCQMKEKYRIQPKHDLVVFPSLAAMESFADQTGGEVIQNITLGGNKKMALILVSASRFTYEKGEQRMYILADRLNKAGIPFVWMVFTDADIKSVPGIVRMNPRMDVRSFMAAADYVVQLSDKESFCYSIVEALELGTAVLATPLDILPEIGFEEGKHGYIIPKNMEFTDTWLQIIATKVPIFKYDRTEENKNIKKRWKEILGNTTKQWKEHKGKVRIRIVSEYYDTEKGRMVSVGEEFLEEPKRADRLIFNGVAKVANNEKIDML